MGRCRDQVVKPGTYAEPVPPRRRAHIFANGYGGGAARYPTPSRLLRSVRRQHHDGLTRQADAASAAAETYRVTIEPDLAESGSEPD
jgi:hypothetical protein